MSEIRRDWCDECGRETKQVRVKTIRDQTLGHILLTFFTGGLWLLPWIIIICTVKPRWACDRCGENYDG